MAKRNRRIAAGFIFWFGIACAGCYEVTDAIEPLPQNEQEHSTDGKDGESDSDTDTECVRDTNCGNNIFTGIVRDAVSREPLAGVTVVALSNDTTFEMLSDEVTTADDGTFVFNDLEPDLMCIKVVGTEGEDERVDTFSCNVSTNEHNRVVVSTPYAIAATSALGLTCACDPTEAAITGTVLYRTDDGQEKPVSCATVQVEGMTDAESIFYFTDTLPNPVRSRTDAGGRFLVLMVPPGLVQLTAIVNGEVIGNVSAPIQAPLDSTGGEFNSNIVHIYADQAGDPTPDCTE